MKDLVVDRVSKRYQVQRTEDDRAPATLVSRLRALRGRKEEFWALRDVSFDVTRGETLGIIGDNGAGKSTILKLLSGVTAPTSGQITINGRLSALIEVGSGFHPELTGRENVFLSGSILGMRRREIADKLERIVEFAGVRPFIDTPVKRYSSGMYLRLGFSIAAHLEPDILLLDEVLAVGDAEFQAKCMDRVTQLHRHGRTIVFISHDLAAVERLCSRVVLMRHGQVAADGPARDVIATYQEVNRARVEPESETATQFATSGEVKLTGLVCLGEHGDAVDTVTTGSPVTFRLSYVAHVPLASVVFELEVCSRLSGHLGPWCQLTTASPGGDGISLHAGSGVVQFDVPCFGLQPADCSVSIRVARPGTAVGTAIAWWHEALWLRILPGRRVRGTFLQPHTWRLLQESSAPEESPVELPG
jgi:ABC-type polysaccharide/polyol phosphate transport system ATPase subunit